MYLITGSTGHIGRPLVEQLHKEGHDVRALVRDASRAELLPGGIDIAWVELMKRLGYKRWAAQGGDWGAVVTGVFSGFT